MSEQNQIVRENIDNVDTDLELEFDAEGESDGLDRFKPYDPEEIRVDTHQFSLRNILDMIQDNEVDLAPDFQRFKVWTPEQKSRLVESVLLRIPLPAFYFSSDKKGKMQVVDGVQRLSTLNEYVRTPSSFPLVHLEYLDSQLRGKIFSDLDTEWTSRINRTQLTVNVIDPKTPHRVKFDIFKRLNTGGSPLTAQEIRHCMSQNRSRTLLKNVVESDQFKRALPPEIVDHKRMANREMALRASGFWLHHPRQNQAGIYSEKTFRDYDSLDEFLNATTEIIDDKLTDSELETLQSALLNGIDNSFRLFRIDAFRKFSKNSTRRNPVNKSLFEVWTICLSEYSWNAIQPHAEKIVDEFYNLCSNRSFDDSISRSTASAVSVATRFSMIETLLTKVGL